MLAIVIAFLVSCSLSVFLIGAFVAMGVPTLVAIGFGGVFAFLAGTVSFYIMEPPPDEEDWGDWEDEDDEGF